MSRRNPLRSSIDGRKASEFAYAQCVNILEEEGYGALINYLFAGPPEGTRHRAICIEVLKRPHKRGETAAQGVQRLLNAGRGTRLAVISGDGLGRSLEPIPETLPRIYFGDDPKHDMVEDCKRILDNFDELVKDLKVPENMSPKMIYAIVEVWCDAEVSLGEVSEDSAARGLLMAIRTGWKAAVHRVDKARAEALAKVKQSA